MLIVQKYGGSSVSTVDKIKEIACHIKSLHEEGASVIMVVSAMGKTTNSLIKLAEEITTSPSKREMDRLMSTGELQSVSLMSIALNAIGVKAISMSGRQAGFITDNGFMRAFIDKIDTSNIKKKLEEGFVVVVAGFQGVTKDGEITTFGRGGSDTTATALAGALGAVCEIYTDVEAVYSVDPNVFPKAKKIHALTYDEMMEMAVGGAKVLEPRSVELAKKYKVPLYLGKTLEKDKTKGTWVMEKVEMEKMGVKSLSVKEDVTVFMLKLSKHKMFLWKKVIKAIVVSLINYEMFSQIDLGNFVMFSFATPTNMAEQVKEQIEAEFDEDFDSLVATNTAYVHAGLSRFTLVGSGLATHTKIAGALFETLTDNQIPYGFVTNSEISISFTVDREKKEQTVNLLSEKFDL